MAAGDASRRPRHARSDVGRRLFARFPCHRARPGHPAARRATDAVGVPVHLCVHDAVAWRRRRRPWAPSGRHCLACALCDHDAGLCDCRQHRDALAVPRAPGRVCGRRPGRGPRRHSRSLPWCGGTAPDGQDHAGVRDRARHCARTWGRPAQHPGLAFDFLDAAGARGCAARSGRCAAFRRRCLYTPGSRWPPRSYGATTRRVLRHPDFLLLARFPP